MLMSLGKLTRFICIPGYVYCPGVCVHRRDKRACVHLNMYDLLPIWLWKGLLHLTSNTYKSCTTIKNMLCFILEDFIPSLHFIRYILYHKYVYHKNFEA